MASMIVKDGSGADVYLEIDGGAGSIGDPYRIKNYVSLLNSSVPVTDNGSSLTVDGTIAFSNTSINTQGMVAHDAADSGNPHKVGYKAEASVATATMVADADRSDGISDLDGLQIIKPFCPFGDIKAEYVSITTNTSTAFSNFGAVASTRNYITTISVYNTATTATYVEFKDGTAGATFFVIPLPAAAGAVLSFAVPLRQPTANTALAYKVNAAVTTAHISVVGFQSKL